MSELAAAAGYDDPERWWEDVVEHVPGPAVFAALAAHFGDGVLRPADVAGGITGAVITDPVSDRVAWQEYLETVVRDRDDWSDFYRACRDVAG